MARYVDIWKILLKIYVICVISFHDRSVCAISLLVLETKPTRLQSTKADHMRIKLNLDLQTTCFLVYIFYPLKTIMTIQLSLALVVIHTSPFLSTIIKNYVIHRT